MKVRLWFICETLAARLYSKVPLVSGRAPDKTDEVWIPRSITEGTTKYDAVQHEVTLPEWFVEQRDL